MKYREAKALIAKARSMLNTLSPSEAETLGALIDGYENLIERIIMFFTSKGKEKPETKSEDASAVFNILETKKARMRELKRMGHAEGEPMCRYCMEYSRLSQEVEELTR